jgi:hydrogenase maturation factor HypF (carbamoyltransferase family)
VGVTEPARNAGNAIARRIRLRGHVQGVGFRPFVYRLALEHGIAGHVQNQLGEVQVLAIQLPKSRLFVPRFPIRSRS